MNEITLHELYSELSLHISAIHDMSNSYYYDRTIVRDKLAQRIDYLMKEIERQEQDLETFISR